MWYFHNEQYSWALCHGSAASDSQGPTTTSQLMSSTTCHYTTAPCFRLRVPIWGNDLWYKTIGTIHCLSLFLIFITGNFIKAKKAGDNIAGVSNLHAFISLCPCENVINYAMSVAVLLTKSLWRISVYLTARALEDRALKDIGQDNNWVDNQTCR